jgi:hypothetical protein
MLESRQLLSISAPILPLSTTEIASLGGTLLGGNPASASPALAVLASNVAPATAGPTATISPVSPNPNNTGPSSITITFSEPVTGFNTSDLILDYGGANLLTSAQTLTTTDNQTWTLNNLAPITNKSGTYFFYVEKGAIQDSGGNSLVASTSISFSVEAWQNTPDPLDVDNSGLIAPLDALLVINDLNSQGARTLPQTFSGSFYFDVNGDGAESPIDELQILNYLNANSGTVGRIQVAGSNQPITDGATTTSASNNTAFGSLVLGASPVSETYTITNDGGATLTLGTVSIGGANSGDFKVISQPSATLAIGTSTSFTVQFAPTAAGTRAATLSFSENDPSVSSPFTFAISGVAISQPKIGVSGNSQTITDGATTTSATNSTAFGNTLLNGNTLSETYTINNTGTASLTLGNVMVGGANAGEFSVTTQPGSSVPAGGNTTFTVQFTPTSNGTQSATINFSENDPTTSTPFTFAVSAGVSAVGVSGNGQIIVDGASITNASNGTAIGSVVLGSGPISETYTITNEGASALTLGTVTVSGASATDFQVTNQPNTTVASGSSTTFTVQFSPGAAGYRETRVMFTESDPTVVSPFAFTVSGVGATIGVFGNGQSIVDGTSTTSAASDTDFGNAAVTGSPVSETYTITNAGTAPLTVGTVTIGGTNPGDFTVTSQPSSPVPVGGSTTFTIQFAPAAGGARSARVSFTDSDPTTFSPFAFTIAGTGTTQELIGVLGNSQPIAAGKITTSATDDTAFGSTLQGGSPLSETYTITNSGTGALMLGTVTIGGTNSGDFTVTTQPSSSVPIGGGTTFTVQFAPTAVGNRTATVSFSQNDSTQPNPYTFAISGVSLASTTVAVSGNGQPIVNGATTSSATNRTAFGSTPLYGAPLSETYTINNTGTAALTVGTVTIGGANPGDFKVTSQPAAQVAIGGSTTFTVQFVPTIGGARTATVSFNDNDPTQPNPFTFAVGGVATTQSQINVSGDGQTIIDGASTPDTANGTALGSTLQGGIGLTQTYTITNTGTATLNLGTVSTGGPNAADFTVAMQPAATVPVGGSTAFTLQFIPTAVGARTATVSFTEDDPTTSSPFTFAVSGVATNISVTGSGQPIANGAITPSMANDTAFGTTLLASNPFSETYKITNSGTTALTLGTVMIGGANAGDFSVTTQPSNSVSSGGSTTFTVQFAPTAVGTRTATISFSENDPTVSSPFTFAVSGVVDSTQPILVDREMFDGQASYATGSVGAFSSVVGTIYREAVGPRLASTSGAGDAGEVRGGGNYGTFNLNPQNQEANILQAGGDFFIKSLNVSPGDYVELVDVVDATYGQNSVVSLEIGNNGDFWYKYLSAPLTVSTQVDTGVVAPLNTWFDGWIAFDRTGGTAPATYAANFYFEPAGAALNLLATATGNSNSSIGQLVHIGSESLGGGASYIGRVGMASVYSLPALSDAVSPSDVLPPATTPYTYYVNAATGNDSNDGLSPATALKSLAAVDVMSQYTGFLPFNTPANPIVTSLAIANGTATVTAANHNLQTGDTVVIDGAFPVWANGDFKVTVLNANTFTYTIAATPPGGTGTVAATGSIVCHVIDYGTQLVIDNSITPLDFGASTLNIQTQGMKVSFIGSPMLEATLPNSGWTQYDPVNFPNIWESTDGNATDLLNTVVWENNEWLNHPNGFTIGSVASALNGYSTTGGFWTDGTTIFLNPGNGTNPNTDGDTFTRSRNRTAGAAVVANANDVDIVGDGTTTLTGTCLFTNTNDPTIAYCVEFGGGGTCRVADLTVDYYGSHGVGNTGNSGSAALPDKGLFVRDNITYGQGAPWGVTGGFSQDVDYSNSGVGIRFQYINCTSTVNVGVIGSTAGAVTFGPGTSWLSHGSGTNFDGGYFLNCNFCSGLSVQGDMTGTVYIQGGSSGGGIMGCNFVINQTNVIGGPYSVGGSNYTGTITNTDMLITAQPSFTGGNYWASVTGTLIVQGCTIDTRGNTHAIGQQSAIWGKVGTAAINFEDNVFLVDADKDFTLLSDFSSTDNLVIDHNAYQLGTSGFIVRNYNNGTTTANQTFVSWQALGKDVDSTNGRTLALSSSGQPQSGSPAINAGISLPNLAGRADLLGKIRPATGPLDDGAVQS